MESKLGAVELSLTMGCALGCKYCPQDKLLKAYYRNNASRARYMTMDVFKRVLDNTQKKSVVGFSGMSEPFSNVHCADMICYAYNNGYEVALNTTLMGMTMEDYEKLEDINFSRVIVHVPDENNNSHFNISDSYKELLYLVDKNWNIERYSCHGRLNKSVHSLINREKIGKVAFNDRAGNLERNDVPHYCAGRVKGPIYCANSPERVWASWCHVVLPDGTVILCCNDYGMKHELGNLLEETWDEICQKDSYKKLLAGLENDCEDILCRSCNNAVSTERLPAITLKRMLKDYAAVAFYPILGAIKNAQMIIGYGIGKLFRDHYYMDGWNELFQCEYFCDSSLSLQGKTIFGKKCISPNELPAYKEALVVVFVREPAKSQIINMLYSVGIKRVIAVDDIYDVYRAVVNAPANDC